MEKMASITEFVSNESVDQATDSFTEQEVFCVNGENEVKIFITHSSKYYLNSYLFCFNEER
jgi:hypothetical protein